MRKRGTNTNNNLPFEAAKRASVARPGSAVTR